MSPLQPFPFSCVRRQRAKEPGFSEMVEGGEQDKEWVHLIFDATLWVP